MSDTTDVINAWLGLASSAISGASTNDGPVNWGDIGPGEFPYVMIYGVECSVDLLSFRQERRNLRMLMEVVCRDETQDEMLVYLDDLRTQVSGDRYLSGHVDWAWISGFTLIPSTDGSRKALLVEISSEEVV